MKKLLSIILLLGCLAGIAMSPFLDHRRAHFRGTASHWSANGATLDATNDYLKSMWRLNEASGNRADNKGTNTLVDNGSVGSTSDGTHGTVPVLGSNAQYFSVAHSADFNFSTGDFTFGGWVKISNDKADGYTGSHCFMHKGWNGSAGFVLLTGNQVNGQTGQVTLYSAKSTSGLSTTGLNVVDGNWHFILLVCASNVLTIYVDNSDEATTTDATSIDTSSTLYIGANPGDANFWFKGNMSKLVIFNRALTAGEMTALYNAGAGSYYSP